MTSISTKKQDTRPILSWAWPDPLPPRQETVEPRPTTQSYCTFKDQLSVASYVRIHYYTMAESTKGNSDKFILVTGGAGYVGSHTVLELLQAGDYQPVVVDNLGNSSTESIRRVETLTGKKVDVHTFDLLDRVKLKELFMKYKFYAVIHFAGLKAVGESVRLPLRYYRINIEIALNLIETMEEFEVRNFIFSSSATVYGDPQYLPIDEKHPTGNCSNPYGKTKYFVEEILADYHKSNTDWNIVLLRYFNPVGAHKSGMIGEDPRGVPNNLMPFVSQVAVGTRPELLVFGSDYNTPDGTGVRDYIHIVDLALGHVATLRQIDSNCGLKVYNLGTGKGVSVMELADALGETVGKPIPRKIVGRREGDIATCYADPSLAERELQWKATRDLAQMCEDTWRWQSNNPQGYNSKE